MKYSVVACHKLSHFNSRLFKLDFTWKCCRLLEASKFSRNPGQFNWVTRETRYHVSIAELFKRNLMSQVTKLFRRPRTMLKILYFSQDHQFVQKSPGIKFLYDQGIKLFHLLAKEAWFFQQGDSFSKIINRGSHRGTCHQGTSTGCLQRLEAAAEICSGK